MMNGPDLFPIASSGIMNGFQETQKPAQLIQINSESIESSRVDPIIPGEDALHLQSAQGLKPLMLLMEISEEQHRLQIIETQHYLDQHLAESTQRIDELLKEIFNLKEQLIHSESRQNELGISLHAQIAAKEQELVVCKEEVRKLTSKIADMQARESLLKQNLVVLAAENEINCKTKEAACMELEAGNKVNEARIQALKAEMEAMRAQLESQVRDAEARTALLFSQKVAAEQAYEAQIAELKLRNKNFEAAIENAPLNREQALRAYLRTRRNGEGDLLCPGIVDHIVGLWKMHENDIKLGLTLQGKPQNYLGLPY